MSDEPFLARWSRLKRRQAERPDEAAEQPEAAEPAGEPIASVEPPPTESPELPAIETIDAETDIRAFLARGVPAELTRAALRTAWAADPTIRDFVGLSENSWDFNAPETIPGFAGPLPASESASLARLFDRAETAAPEATAPGPDVESEVEARSSSSDRDSVTSAEAETDRDIANECGAQQIPSTDSADAKDSTVGDTANLGPSKTRRGHGGAVPQ